MFQYNKRDVDGALPIERLRQALNPGMAPEVEAIAAEGKGVAEALRAACKAVIKQVSVTALVPPVAPARFAPPLPARVPRDGMGTRAARRSHG